MDFLDRVQKSVLSSANVSVLILWLIVGFFFFWKLILSNDDDVCPQAFGDMYLTLARADKEVGLVRRHSEIAKAATIEAHAAIREKNVLQLKVGRLERELK